MEERNTPKIEDLEQTIKRLTYDVEYIKDCLWNLSKYLINIAEGIDIHNNYYFYEFIKEIPWRIDRNWKD